MILSVQNIHKSYGRIKALNGVSFDVPPGSVYGILGPNGSGKTTLLSILLDVLKADSGQFTWFEKPSSGDTRKQIGSLLETPNFYHYLSGERNLKITSAISGRGNEQQIHEVLKEVSLYERKRFRFSSYSLGMKQRLAIGAALLGKPQVLVLDEPTNGLDPVGILEIRQLIQKLNQQGHTILMASHLLDEVEKICTHVAILKKGNLVASGAVEEVLKGGQQIELSAAVENHQLIQMISLLPGVEKVEETDNGLLVVTINPEQTDSEKLNLACFQSGIILNHLQVKKKRLEEKFFELTS
jgi:ABC-2 type transport system ATP-binding protein